MKRLQNRIAEGGLTLPVAALYALFVWLAAGLVARQLFPQLACFVATVYVLVELSNQNALLRVRSRMVSATFIVLSCTAPALFASFTGAAVQLCSAISLLLLLHTYQDPAAVGRTFYAFAMVGVASMLGVHILLYVPVIWLLMATQLQALSWRTWLASLIGLATPYWFASLWFIYQQDFTPLAQHFALLGSLRLAPQLLTTHQLLPLLFALALTLVGMAHFWQYSFEEKIRIRLLYGLFSVLSVLSLGAAALMPQHQALFMPLGFLFASPLAAHVLTFTSSRLSNILFLLTLALALALTVYNLL